MDAEESVEITALSTDEAILLGLTRLAATRAEVKIEILDEGSRGFLGLGTRMARVRLTLRESLDEVPSSDTEGSNLSEKLEIPVIDEDNLEDATALPLSEMVDVAEPESLSTEAGDAQKPQQDTTINQKIDSPDSSVLYQQVEQAVQVTADNLLASLSVKYSTEWRMEEERPTIWISIRGSDADSIVGPRAQTLNSVQYLFRTLVHRHVSGTYDLVVDADGYRMRRRRSLENLAHKNAEKAVESGQTVRLRSMPAHERRIIHMILRDDERVITRSVGSGRDRAITIIPNSDID